MLKTKAYCPAAISLLFKKCINGNIALTGSVGVGFTVNCGITATVENSDTNEIFFNSEKINFPTVIETITKITKQKVKVSLTSPLPLGSGFGLSGGGSLAIAYAVNQLFNTGKTGKELALISHTAEINNRTGLGTVGTQITGGFLVKTAPGLPVESLSVGLTGQKIRAVVVGRLITPDILKNGKTVEKVNSVAGKILETVYRKPELTLNDYLDLSYDFSRQAELIRNEEVRSIIERIRKNGDHSAMAILGNVVLTTAENINSCYPTHTLTISNDKVRLI